MKKILLLRNKIEDWLNDLSLKRKLWVLYYVCILIPLIITDGIILYILVSEEQAEQQNEMRNIANAVQYNITSYVENSAVLARSINTNSYVMEFLSTQYASPQSYVAHYYEFTRDSLIQGVMGIDNSNNRITLYADNETIVNGGWCCKLSRVAESPWYKLFGESMQKTLLLFYFDDWNSPYVQPERKMLFLQRLDQKFDDKAEKLLKIEVDYGSLVRNISNMNYDFPVYLCNGDRLLFSNIGPNNTGQDFTRFAMTEEAGVEQKFDLYGSELTIYVLERRNNILSMIEGRLPLIAFLLLLNIILPQLLMNSIERSVTVRIRRLSQVFDQVDSDELITIDGRGGRDEIGGLMENYNLMAERMNGLIQTVYKNKLREQEMDIARQKAELLALYSQIDPHFLFNALESIRMHSIIKDEQETARMVEKLAVLERRNVDWSTGMNTVKAEIEFVEAYLELQKYRFGDRLFYRLEVDSACDNILIPKLSITTFVENACVHGIESKAATGWVFVRVYTEDEMLCIEVEDTGGGMEEPELERLRYRMEHASIEMLKEKDRVGIVNVCLRIRMVTEDRTQFSLESEKGIGTVVLIRMPYDSSLWGGV
ncbi:MAG: histidine kinase [Lachnospiraceae bacterium]|nr:histidine kinase [Lachnospiraceae bacterium]